MVLKKINDSRSRVVVSNIYVWLRNSVSEAGRWKYDSGFRVMSRIFSANISVSRPAFIHRLHLKHNFMLFAYVFSKVVAI